MCHVSDLCASSPWPLDQTIIRSMVKMGWSCTSLHASVHWGDGARRGRFGAFARSRTSSAFGAGCGLHGSNRGPAACCPFCVDVVTAAPAGVDYIGLHSLWNWYFFTQSSKYSKWYVRFDHLDKLFAMEHSKFFLRLFCYERKFELLLFLIFTKLYMYYLIFFWCTFWHILQNKSREPKLVELIR